MKKLFLLIYMCGFVLFFGTTLALASQPSDDFEDGVIDARWIVGSAKRSCGGWCGLGNWTYSHQEIVDPVDGYLNMRVQGPVSGLTYGAEAWVQTTYNFNDGKSYIINFTWEPNFANYDYHVNGYYIQVTDGYISPGYSFLWGFLQYPESVDLLWDETNVLGTRGWFFANKPSTGKLNWSLRILPLKGVSLYDGPNALGNLKYQAPLDRAYPWYIRFMVSDGTSAGFPAGDAWLNLYDFTVVQLPDLVIGSLKAPTTACVGATISIKDTTKNQGTATAGASTTKFYLDTTPASRAVPLLKAGGISTMTTPLSIPSDIPIGKYYIIAHADDSDVVAETYELNNETATAISIGPDLIVTALTAPTSASRGTTITINDTTKNNGCGLADASMTQFYLSKNTILDPTDIALGSRSVPSLGTGVSSGPLSTNVVIPLGIPTGSYYIIAVSDDSDVVEEANETNNIKRKAITITP